MSFATITPTRNDRPHLLEFCKKQLERMTIKPAQSYFIDYKPISTRPDLTERLQKGIEMAIKDGHEYAFIMEDDDAYPVNYFQNFLEAMNVGHDFIGASKTTYYNLKNKTYETFDHPGRASLFCTGIRLKALDKFVWPKAGTIFIDMYLWNWAKKNHFTTHLIDQPIALGIKHGLGLCGGKAHKMELKHRDYNHSHLRSLVDEEAFKFYLTMFNR